MKSVDENESLRSKLSDPQEHQKKWYASLKFFDTNLNRTNRAVRGLE